MEAVSKPAPRRLALRAAALTTCLMGLVQCSPADPTTQVCREPTTLRFNIAGKIVRSAIGFTQGLEFRDGKLYESTGRIGGTTQLNVISLTGQVTTLADQGIAVFGEGLTILKDDVFQLTWQEHDVFVYDLAGKLKRKMQNPREGWGLTNDGTNLIFSDGGPSFYYADPKTFAIPRRSGSAPTSAATSPASMSSNSWTASSTAMSSRPAPSYGSIRRADVSTPSPISATCGAR